VFHPHGIVHVALATADEEAKIAAMENQELMLTSVSVAAGVLVSS